MSTDFFIAPGNTNTLTAPPYEFVFGMNWEDGVAWSDDAVLRIVAEDGSESHDFGRGEGVVAGDLVVFTFADAQPGIRYRGLIVDGDLTLELFAAADLCALQHPYDAAAHLPFPTPAGDDAPGADPDDAVASAGGDDPGASGGAGDPMASGDADSGPADATSAPLMSDDEARAEIDVAAVQNACAPWSPPAPDGGALG